MHNQNNLIKKLLITFLVYSIILLFIGRHMTFLPTVKIGKQNDEIAASTSNINREVLDKFLTAEDGTYSIYYKDLNDNAELGIDENKVVTAASLNKLIIAAYLYELAEAGEIDLEDKITVQEADVQDYGTGSIRYDTQPKAYSIKQLMKLMMGQSDNTAAHVLTVRLGEDMLNAFIREKGLVATDLINNKTSAKDMGRLLEMIYVREIAGEALTLELLGFMKDTDFEDRLARNFDSDVNVHHKAGDAITMVHDVGIIDDGRNAFVLAILTTDMVDEEVAKQGIGNIAKFIHDSY